MFENKIFSSLYGQENGQIKCFIWKMCFCKFHICCFVFDFFSQFDMVVMKKNISIMTTLGRF